MAEAAGATVSKKPRRVRTGCLTCRERHLKCDETPGECLNCRKSQRECKRGVRLNFIDTKVDQIPEVAFVPPQERSVGFVDESREIASEYVGGAEAYASRQALQAQVQTQNVPQEAYDGVYRQAQVQAQAQAQGQQLDSSYDYRQAHVMNAPVMQPQQLPHDHGSTHSGQPDPYGEQKSQQYRYQQQQPHHQYHEHQQHHQQNQHQQPPTQQRDTSFDTQPQQMKVEYEPMALLNSASSSSANAVPRPHPVSHQSHTSMEEEEQAEIRDVLNQADETLFMQVFVEEVGLWMDSMDSMKHVS